MEDARLVHRMLGGDERAFDEFFDAYHQTGDLCMVLQEDIEFEEYYRCYVIGRRHVHIMPYEPRNPMHLRYQAGFTPGEELARRITKDCLTICNSLGYDMNTVEFAVRDGIPYAIDYMNPAPDAERDSIGGRNGAVRQHLSNWITIRDVNDVEQHAGVVVNSQSTSEGASQLRTIQQ